MLGKTGVANEWLINFASGSEIVLLLYDFCRDAIHSGGFSRV